MTFYPARKEFETMMDKLIHRRILLFYILFAVAAALILAIARTMLMVNFFDCKAEMYENTTTVPVLFRILTGIVCVFLCTSYIFFRNKTVSGAAFRNVSLKTVFTSSLCCFMMFSYFIVTVYGMFANGFSQYAVFSSASSQANERSRLIFLTLHLILLIPAAIYFFRVASAFKNVGNAFCVLSMITVVWLMVLLIATYLDISVSFNSPNKILSQICLIAVMLYMVYETRFNMGIPRLRFYLPISFMTIVLCTMFSVSNLILSTFSLIEFQHDTVFDVMMLTFALYITSRCLSFLQSGEEKNPAAA